MSGEILGGDAAPSRLEHAPEVPPPIDRRKLALITAGAVAVFFALRILPTGTSLSHMDFRVDAKNSIEFCDPLNPQFIPVVAVRSPVTMSINPISMLATGEEARCVLTLRTASGKPIAVDDLLVAHTKKLHLLIIDRSLTDYQHVHPEPAKNRSEWEFVFTPRAGGAYRVFADFTPAATARGLYASADLSVVGPASDSILRVATHQASSGKNPADAEIPSGAVERAGFRFTLTPGLPILHAGQPVDLGFAVERLAGGAVPLEPVMGAFAHLVAFDEARTGFAHLHPMETDLATRPDGTRPVLNFKVTIPHAGRYVIWAQVNLGGHEVFAPFWFEVM